MTNSKHVRIKLDTLTWDMWHEISLRFSTRQYIRERVTGPVPNSWLRPGHGAGHGVTVQENHQHLVSDVLEGDITCE
jgi:hypothetical protein